MDWQAIVYGGMKPDDTERQPSRNVQSTPKPVGQAESDLLLAVDEYDVKRCKAKIEQMRAAGYSWQRIANIGAVAKGTAWHYGNGVTPDAGFIERIMSHNSATVRLTPVCQDCGSVHHARCNGNHGAAVVLADGETVRRPGQQRKRRNYWRPCLPASLTPEQRAQVLALAAELEGRNA